MVKKIKILTLALFSTLLTNAQCVNDTINPWFVNFQYEVTIECGEFTNMVMPVIDDDCDDDIEIAMLEDVIFGECEGTQTRYRLYRAFDDAGNQAVEMQTIYVTDITPPTIVGDIYLNVSTSTNLNTAFVDAFDNCSSTTLTYNDVEVSGNSIIRTYSAVDGCDNVSTFEQIIHMSNNVAICHHLGNGNYITIYVAPQAVNAHLAHGDYLGPCTGTNQWFPSYELEKLPSGEVKKYIRCK